MGETTNMLQASVDLDGQVSVSVPLAALPALINALLRLCTHAQLGEVVVPRGVAGCWERADTYSSRHMNGGGRLIGRALVCVGGWSAHGVVGEQPLGVGRAVQKGAVRG